MNDFQVGQPTAIVDNGWDDVRHISKTCRRMIDAAAIVIPVVELFKVKPAAFIGHDDVLSACRAIMADVQELTQELDQLDRKIGQEGSDMVMDDQGFFKAHEIYQYYSVWIEQYENLIPPNLAIVASFKPNAKSATN